MNGIGKVVSVVVLRQIVQQLAAPAHSARGRPGICPPQTTESRARALHAAQAKRERRAKKRIALTSGAGTP